MKTSLVIIALALAGSAFAQEQGAQQPANQAPQEQRKEIKNPAEYNAYITALNQQQPDAKAGALETFLQQYPESVMKIDALELLMATYQQLGDQAKVEDAATRVLQAESDNLRALALLAYLKRASAEAGQNSQENAQQARQYGEQGLQALTTAKKPEGMGDEDFQKLKDQVEVIFHGSAGFGALQTKDHAVAQEHLTAAVEANPDDLRNVYPLALSYLEATPMNPVGLWHVARAVNLSQNNKQITDYGRFRYMKYHGSEEGWQELLQTASQSPMPPEGWAVGPAPTPEEEAAALAQSKDPKEMDIAEWTLVLTVAPQNVRETFWQQITGTKVPFAARVIEANRTTLMLAATADAIQENRADVQVTMTAPLTAAQTPKPGSDVQIMAEVESYDPEPFIINMTGGLFIKSR